MEHYCKRALGMILLSGIIIGSTAYEDSSPTNLLQNLPQFYSGAPLKKGGRKPSSRQPRLIIQNPQKEPKSINDLANYDFEYQIHGGGNFYGHAESKTGKETTGQYYVVLPDFRRQVVKYYVDSSGYHATVSYEPVSSSSEAVASKTFPNLEPSSSRSSLKMYKKIVRRRIPKRRRSSIIS